MLCTHCSANVYRAEPELVRDHLFLDPDPGFCSHLIIKFHLGCSASGLGSDLDTIFHPCLGEQYTQRGLKGALDSIILSFCVSDTLKKGY